MPLFFINNVVIASFLLEAWGLGKYTLLQYTERN